MPPLLDPPETVPFEEVAEVLGEATHNVLGGPAVLISASGRHLATALDAAGFRVVRDRPDDRQLTL